VGKKRGGSALALYGKEGEGLGKKIQSLNSRTIVPGKEERGKGTGRKKEQP